MVLIERAVVGVGDSQRLHAFARLQGTLDEIHRGTLDAVAGTPIQEQLPKFAGVLTVTGLETRDPTGRYRTLLDNAPKYSANGKVDLGKIIGNKTPELGAEHFPSIRQMRDGFHIAPGDERRHLRDLSHNDCYATTLWIEALEELGGATTEASKDSILRRFNHLPGLEGEFSFQGRTLYLNGRPLATATGGGKDVEVKLEFGTYHPATYEALAKVPGVISVGLNINAGPVIEVWNPKTVLRLDQMYSPLSKELLEDGLEQVPIVLRDEDLGQTGRVVLRAEAESLRPVRMDMYTTVTTQTPAAALGHNYTFERGMAIDPDVAPDQIGAFLQKYDVHHRLRAD